MKYTTYISFIVITILATIVISGCGNGENITYQPSINTPSTDFQDNLATLSLTINWPQVENFGEIYIFPAESNKNEFMGNVPLNDYLFGESIESSSEKNLTASIPFDTQLIKIELFRESDMMPIKEKTITRTSIYQIRAFVEWSQLPIDSIVVRVSAYPFYDNSKLISLVEQKYQLYAGDNPLFIDLGRYFFHGTTSNAIYNTPIPIVTYLEVDYPFTDIPDEYGPPFPTPKPEYTQPGIVPVKNRKLYYNIIGKRLDPNSPIEPSLSTVDPNFAITDDTGRVETNFTLLDDIEEGSGEEVIVEIRVPLDPENRHGVGFYMWLIYKEGYRE